MSSCTLAVFFTVLVLSVGPLLMLANIANLETRTVTSELLFHLQTTKKDQQYPNNESIFHWRLLSGIDR